MDSFPRYLMAESDVFIGQRRRFKRYLVCSLQGYFPVLLKTGPNALKVVYRTGATHVGISGTVAVAGSDDGGVSWSDPVEVQPRWDDARNPALGMNAQGELLVAYWRARLQAYTPDARGRGLLYNGRAESGPVADTGVYYARSHDGGRTWSQPRPYRSSRGPCHSPYGRIIAAPDGTLLMPLYGWGHQGGADAWNESILARSTDGGETWGDESLVARDYNETSFVFLPDGRLVAAARSKSGHVAICHSADLGHTWSTPQPVTRDGEHPADLTLLQSGKLLLSFGRRIRPMGCGLLLSADGGQTWDQSHEVLLAGDGVENTDLGYPSTVQLDDGHLVTVLYYASGSEVSSGFQADWGRVSCQAIHYREEDLL